MKKLYFRTLVLANLFIKVKKSLDLSEKRSASEWKSTILLTSILMLPLNTLYKNVTSVSYLLFCNGMRFNLFKRMSVFRINFVALLCTLSSLSIFLFVYGDHTIKQYSRFKRTRAVKSTQRRKVIQTLTSSFNLAKHSGCLGYNMINVWVPWQVLISKNP